MTSAWAQSLITPVIAGSTPVHVYNTNRCTEIMSPTSDTNTNTRKSISIFFGVNFTPKKHNNNKINLMFYIATAFAFVLVPVVVKMSTLLLARQCVCASVCLDVRKWMLSLVVIICPVIIIGWRLAGWLLKSLQTFDQTVIAAPLRNVLIRVIRME